MTFRLKALLLALAIGGGTVVAATLAIALPFGLPLVEGGDWGGFLAAMLAEMLVAALPFLALALLAERSRVLWGLALAITLLLWGYYVFEAVRYRLNGSSVLAHMGFDVLLFFYPFLLAPILAGASLLRKHLDRSA